jgi:hypothetical protein
MRAGSRLFGASDLLDRSGRCGLRILRGLIGPLAFAAMDDAAAATFGAWPHVQSVSDIAATAIVTDHPWPLNLDSGAVRPYHDVLPSLVSLDQGGILGFMGTGRTVLFAVQEGDIWRVQITWPNGALHYFGKFTSKEDAIEWIGAHSWLTAPATDETIGNPPITGKAGNE